MTTADALQISASAVPIRSPDGEIGGGAGHQRAFPCRERALSRRIRCTLRDRVHDVAQRGRATTGQMIRRSRKVGGDGLACAESRALRAITDGGDTLR